MIDSVCGRFPLDGVLNLRTLSGLRFVLGPTKSRP
jgi:hypothetical protein